MPARASAIGRDRAPRIRCHELTRYVVSTTGFHAAREATPKAAGDLYGTDGTGYAAGDKARAAVGVTAAGPPRSAGDRTSGPPPAPSRRAGRTPPARRARGRRAGPGAGSPGRTVRTGQSARRVMR
ncbi:hypothetical protein ACE1SV_29460 [Streptomyces sennicomposti]